MGVADSSTIFTSRDRVYRFDRSESMMVDHVSLAEVKQMRKNGRFIVRSRREKRWTLDEFLALIPGGFAGAGTAALVQRVKDAMDAGWRPLEG